MTISYYVDGDSGFVPEITFDDQFLTRSLQKQFDDYLN